MWRLSSIAACNLTKSPFTRSRIVLQSAAATFYGHPKSFVTLALLLLLIFICIYVYVYVFFVYFLFMRVLRRSIIFGFAPPVLSLPCMLFILYFLFFSTFHSFTKFFTLLQRDTRWTVSAYIEIYILYICLYVWKIDLSACVQYAY